MQFGIFHFVISCTAGGTKHNPMKSGFRGGRCHRCNMGPFKQRRSTILHMEVCAGTATDIDCSLCLKRRSFIAGSLDGYNLTTAATSKCHKRCSELIAQKKHRESCGRCKTTMTTFAHWRDHVQKHKEEKVQCDLCPHNFFKECLDMHIALRHKTTPLSEM